MTLEKRKYSTMLTDPLVKIMDIGQSQIDKRLKLMGKVYKR